MDYDAFLDLNFTQEELAQIDALSSTLSGPSTSTGGPRILIEVEHSADNLSKATSAVEASHYVTGKSPFERYRKQGRLSVIDLVSPSWCEVQFDYGLRQGRSKSLKSRPKAFVTEAGKEIIVENKVAVRNEVVKKGGSVVHRKLEREIHGKDVKVTVETKEESWAVRLLDTMSRLNALKYSGCCRELFVWGILHDQVVMGCIDEIRRDILLRSPEKSSLKSPKEPSIAQFFPTTHLTVDDIHPSPLHTLYLIDNKTRKAILPSHPDTLSSRLQLMVYWRLLSDLISHKNPFDFMTFWHRLGLNPTSAFSVTFREQMVDSAAQNCLSVDLSDADCLQSLVKPFQETVAELDVCGTVSKTLRLVYRTRAPSPASDSSAEESESNRKIQSKRSKIPAKSRKRKREATDDLLGHESNSSRVTPNVAAGPSSPTREVNSVTAEVGDTSRLLGTAQESVLENSEYHEDSSLPATDGELQREVLHNKTLHSATEVSLAGPSSQNRDIEHNAVDTATSSSTIIDVDDQLLVPVQQASNAVPVDDEDYPGLAFALSQSLLEYNRKSNLTDSDVSDINGVQRVSNHVSTTPSSSDSASTGAAKFSSRIIGTKKFTYNENVLEEHLTDILKWWNGERKPRGVSLENTSRCNTCEYRNGCEWRETKDLEWREKMALKEAPMESLADRLN